MRRFLVGLAAAALWSSVASAQGTPVSELNSAALVGPFDATPGHQTYLTAHAPGGFSPSTGLPQILAHWTFWSDSCDHLADFETCLTLNDSVVIDVTDMGAIGLGNNRLDTRFDLSGFRGLYTVHAFEADARCREPADTGFKLVPEAINGTWTIADTRSNAAFGDRAQSLGLDDTGTMVAVPDERFEALDLDFYNPATLQESAVILVTVVEDFGDFPGELGPPQGRITLGARARACDTQEACLSLPDVEFGCAVYTSLIPGPGSLLPGTLMPSSSGFLRLSTPRFVKEDPSITGDRLWIFAWHGQQLGPFGTASRATYVNPLSVAPTPTPTASPAPTATPGPTATLPIATPTPAFTATPSGGTPTPEATSTPAGTPTSTPAETPTPGGPTSTPAVTPTAAATPTPALSPTPTSALTPTPGPTQLGTTPTPDAFGP